MRVHRQFGTDEGGGFNAATKAYKSDPSLENYVALRRQHPSAEIEVAVTGGIDQAFYIQPVVERFGIDIDLVLGALDADAQKISQLSLLLMEKMIAAKRLSRRGQTQLIRRGAAVPDKLIDWLISISLDALSWNDHLYIPRDLIVLVRERIGGANFEYERASRAHQQKHNAAIIAGQLKAQGIRPTFKLVGKALNVAPSTVKR
ncbi:hypothetical protein V1290_005654 [Bradyrhizobium sp. AZCC 1578]|uniref:hypothetical protein n=1 Tax=Bradyrhizobium sp. AZCC 1578 TaxID=3117027 RepID=UPI002FEFB175